MASRDDKRKSDEPESMRSYVAKLWRDRDSERHRGEDKGNEILVRLKHVFDNNNFEQQITDDDDLNEHFGEVFGIISLIKTLTRVASDEFLRVVLPHPNPSVLFVDSAAHYVDTKAFESAKLQHVNAVIYKIGYEFFEGYIASIEIVLPTAVNHREQSAELEFKKELSIVYFVKPLCCKCVLETAKKQLYNSVPVATPQQKLKFLVSYSQQIYRVANHTRDLSVRKISLFGGILGCFGLHSFTPFNFFVKNNSRNLVWTSYVMLFLAIIANWVLSIHMRVDAPLDEVDGIHIEPFTAHIPVFTPSEEHSSWFFGDADDHSDDSATAQAQAIQALKNKSFLKQLDQNIYQRFCINDDYREAGTCKIFDSPWKYSLSVQSIVDIIGYMYLIVAVIRLYIYALLFVPIAIEESTEALRNEKKRSLATTATGTVDNMMPKKTSEDKNDESKNQDEPDQERGVHKRYD